VDPSSTIIAIASPPGRSPRAIIRLSGTHTLNLISSASDLPSTSPRGLHRLRLSLKTIALPTLALTFPAPHSYTGEDAAELFPPGNPDLLERIINELIETAATHNFPVRRAEPGEFTARAFFNNKLTLPQAEGVAATIAARSDAELRAAAQLRHGSLGTLAHSLADNLASALALVEAGIDFTDQEDIHPIPPALLLSHIENLITTLDNHLTHSIGSEQLSHLPTVVLVGPPNAGKSTLFNTLLGRPRAVISSTPGTTRDILAEPLTLPTPHGPAEVMLIDLAGLDEATADAMNELMQTQAREAINQADLILQCVPPDYSSPASSLPPTAPTITIHTKSDLLPHAKQTILEPSVKATIFVSAQSGGGIDQLRQHITNQLADRAVSLTADCLALQPRHEACLRNARKHLEEARAFIIPDKTHGSPLPGARLPEVRLPGVRLPGVELIAASLRAALDELCALSGEIAPDDILGRIFANFCIGK